MDEKKPVPSEERSDAGRTKPRFPGAGPHARKDLTNYDATPGTGSLPGPEDDDGADSVSS